jgi:Uma2 family endonuclease
MAFPVTIQAPKPTGPTDVALPEDVRPKVELIEEDGEPLESDWHRSAIALLIEIVKHYLSERADFYVGGNMFIYFDEKEARGQHFRGPDFFFVKGASRTPMRRYWVVWQEGGLYPHAIIELLSPKTASEDLTTKKDVYERVFRTPDYFCYDPDAKQLQGWRLNPSMRYEPLPRNERGWLWSEELGLWLGAWTGKYLGEQATWLRFYDAEHQLVLTASEAAQHRAQASAAKLDAVAAELTQLKALLASKGILPEDADQ